MKTLIRPAVSLFLVMTLITGVAYPLLVTGAAKIAFPAQAAGSLVVKDGKPVGSLLIGQSFSDPRYFWGRPSATGLMPNNASGSSGSNRGPLNPALVDAENRQLSHKRIGRHLKHMREQRPIRIVVIGKWPLIRRVAVHERAQISLQRRRKMFGDRIQ